MALEAHIYIVFGLTVAVIISLMITHTLRCIKECILVKKLNKIDRNNMDIESMKIEQELSLPLKDDKQQLGCLYYIIWSNHLITYIAFIAGIGYVIFAMMVGFYPGWITCKVLLPLSTGIYQINKSSLYFMGFFRIFTSFKGTTFEISKFKRNLLICYIIVITIINTFGYSYFFKGIIIYDAENHIYQCDIIISLPFSIPSTLFEIITNVLLLVMFIRPLIIASRQLDNSNLGTLNKYVIAKYTLLVIIGVSSTFILMGLEIVLAGPGIFSFMDTAMNAYCVFLMNKLNASIYNKSCKICHNTLLKCCSKHIET